MQEFSSVTASSYDADSLTPLLNEKAAEGWSVVSIVSAGTNIVAYLSRESGELDMIEEAALEVAVEEEIVEEAAAEVAFEEAVVEEAAAELAVEESVVEEVAVAEVAAAVEEPAGWAAAPEETAPPADDSIAGLAAQVAEAEAAPVVAAPAPAPAPAPADRTGGSGRVVRRPVGPLRAAVLGWCRLDRARVSRRPAVHRPAGRLIVASARAAVP